jgi:hypothetical protein
VSFGGIRFRALILRSTATLSGNDLVVRVNKGPTQITRVILRDAAKAMTASELMNFSPFSPDFELRIGDMKEGLQRALQKAGL